MVQPDDNQMPRMRTPCWITKATSYIHTHTQTHTHTHTHVSVIFTAFPRQYWLRERPSILHYTYIACLVLHSVWRVPENNIRCSA